MKHSPRNTINTGISIFDDYYDNSWNEVTQLNSVFYEYYEGKSVIGYATASMSKLRTELEDGKRYYPALLLGMLGVDSNFSRQGKATELVYYIIGLSRKLMKEVGCRLVRVDVRKVQNTDNKYIENENLTKLYKRIGFNVSDIKDKKKTVLYFDLKIPE